MRPAFIAFLSLLVSACSAGDGSHGVRDTGGNGDSASNGDGAVDDTMTMDDTAPSDDTTSSDASGGNCDDSASGCAYQVHPTGSPCAPGDVNPCYPGDPAQVGVGTCAAGTQQCLGSGEIGMWGDCTGAVLPGPEMCDGMDHDCNGVPDDTGAGCACMPGMIRTCYDGPAGTQHVGACADGHQVCQFDGRSWGICSGEVLPMPESCNGIDDDCNGLVDDGLHCACRPGQTQSCYTGPAGTAGVGVCRAGIQTCDGTGSAWGPCTGQMTPTSEVCFNDLDDNCNGMVDEGCPACDPTAEVYANTADALYVVDPSTYAVRLVGAFNFPDDGHSHQMTDIAATDSGAIWGITFDALYRVNRSTADCSLVAPLSGSSMFNALTFLPASTPGGAEQLVAATGEGDYYGIDTTTGAAHLIGNFGMSAGSDGDLVSVTGAGTFATVAIGGVGDLARVNSSTGAISVVGPTGESGTWGLAYWRGRLFGFLQEGAIIVIDPTTGASTRVADTPAQNWWGAAVTTCAPTAPM